jgi:hypothetical protein
MAQQAICAWMHAIGAVPTRARARPVPSSAAPLHYHQESAVHRALMWAYALLPSLAPRARCLASLAEDLSRIVARETGADDAAALLPAVRGLVTLAVSTECDNKRRLLVALPYVLQVALSNRHGVTTYFVTRELHDVLQFVQSGERSDCWPAIRHYYMRCADGYAPFLRECQDRYPVRPRSVEEAQLWRALYAAAGAGRPWFSFVRRLEK